MFGNSVTNIGDYAFYGCGSLTGVTIPDSVTSIGYGAFYNCTGLTNVMFGNSVTSIGDYAFYGCTSLTAITVDALNPVYSSVDGVLFNQSTNTLIQCPEGKAGSYTIPDSVTNIEDYAFFWCTSLTSVMIGNSVTGIGVSAFDTCTSLTSITIPDSVISLGVSAFSDCFSLTSVYFTGNAPSIGSDVFDGDNNVTLYYLPGTTGWDTTFDVPTALWTPQMQTSDASFGVQTNQFGFNITWTSGRVVVVEACTNFAYPVWQPVQTNILTGDSCYFSDPDWTNYPGRFYRLRSP